MVLCEPVESQAEQFLFEMWDRTLKAFSNRIASVPTRVVKPLDL